MRSHPCSFAGQVLFLALVAFMLTAGCNGTSPAPDMTAARQAGLTPYRTATTTLAPSTLVAVISTPTARPSPTPTPFTYTVVRGDTMLGIALRHGLSLEELMAANPEVNPRFLSVGTALILPLGDGNLAMLPTPTPLPLNSRPPICYKTSDGGAWCFVLVENKQAGALENLGARILLYSQDGEVLAEGEAIPPLNVLPKDRSMPLAVFFPPPLPDLFTVDAEILSAVPVPAEDERYLPASVNLSEERIALDGRQAVVSGKIAIAEPGSAAELIWLALVAYDNDGDVVGLRKWEATTGERENSPGQVVVLNSPLEAGGILPFEETVYSLGPPITRVEVLLEARP